MIPQRNTFPLPKTPPCRGPTAQNPENPTLPPGHPGLKSLGYLKRRLLTRLSPHSKFTHSATLRTYPEEVPFHFVPGAQLEPKKQVKI